MQKLDKKQLPQVLGLGAAACGLFGYFGYKIISPTPAAAHSSAAPTVKPATTNTAPGVQVASNPASGSGSPLSATAPDAGQAAPPTPGMRDPFVAAAGLAPAGMPVAKPAAPIAAPAVHAAPIAPAPITITPIALPKAFSAPPRKTAHGRRRERPTQMAALPSFRIGAPTAPPLPGFPAKRATPAPLDPPAWTVTGVLQSGGTQVAVLRNGDIRKFVRAGEMVDRQFRMVEVTRDQVVLRHGRAYFSMALGGAKAVPTKAPTAFVPAAAPSPLPPPIVAAQPEPAAPQPTVAQPTPPQTAQTTASTLPVGAPAAPPQKTPVQLASDDVPARPQPVGDQPADARQCLERGLALYQSGQKAEGRREWQKALTMDDFGASDEASRLLCQHP